MTDTPHLWLRAECKPFEKRTALAPTICKELLDQGFKITVEKSPERIFDDSEYAALGLPLVEAGSWTSAPADAYIVALKELPDATTPLTHRHIMFGHCFKGQDGSAELLRRFQAGHGTLLDLEFLQDDRGTRVAAFGYYAGYAGAAMGLEAWAYRQLHGAAGTKALAHPKVDPFPNEQALIAHVKQLLAEAEQKTGMAPSLFVMGALGRCGRGACDFATAVGLPETAITRWDINETKKGGPFPEICDRAVFVNCIYLTQKIAPFLTFAELEAAGPNRSLSILVDVSCDPNNPNNPIPVYKEYSFFDQPVNYLPVNAAGCADLGVIAIDHLPTLLPREASESYGRQLLPTLIDLRSFGPVWKRAEQKFRDVTQAVLKA
ncbi:hypothetical protein CXG81DRAFT_27145 [Caulochytrium protostelioides]|uniref:Saccharopine dehydrogenase [NAD(+), L-lysine-forming] n=1 Tax=Caulochytrium protostelioides TaxID=1555241 RepID=A0A4P9WWG0_9FUNG|nr:Saccharopine dehydrogenase [Caulochytrium protostelioides]RKP00147.1 hypothetical protein CXG81DRAFT_27145 [Caulochytrium protostelioides]|eukprot:RKP00147.1 hypothetical protein CXG81DRAFT_27145 [Caulochytrium protostelioides]